MLRYMLCALGMAAFFADAAPYDNLAAALNQQQMVNDLRAQCKIRTDVPDEKIRAVFIASTVNHNVISAAADALKKGKKAQYQQQINNVRCPDFSPH